MIATCDTIICRMCARCFYSKFSPGPSNISDRNKIEMGRKSRKLAVSFLFVCGQCCKLTTNWMDGGEQSEQGTVVKTTGV